MDTKKASAPGPLSTRLLTVDEASLMMKRKASTLRRDILLQRIPVVHMGRLVRIPIEFVEKACREGMLPTPPAHEKQTAKAAR